MKCRKCGAKASVNMRHHRLALCKDHFLEWVPNQVERFIKKYRMFTHIEKVLVAVSGGKDSLALWDILYRLGYQVDGLHINLGIDEGTGYSENSQQITERFAAERGLSLHVVDVGKEYAETIPEITGRTLRGKEKPCSVCGLVKRHVMNRIARDHAYDVLVTGHNLDDEAAVLLGNTLTWQSEYILRQSPILSEAPGLARKVKPLFRFYEREMTAYALLRGIEYVYEECPFAVGSTTIYYKEIFNQMENNRPGIKLAFYLKFIEAREKGFFMEREDIQQELHPCPSCGQPTSAPGECVFCRMIGKIQEERVRTNKGS